MFEKCNPAHPDKIADRIAGALVDYAYSIEKTPKIAVEVLIGHGLCTIIAETSRKIPKKIVKGIVYRIAGKNKIKYVEVPQDVNLAHNQNGHIKCGDNGIFKGVPITDEQRELTLMANDIYHDYESDGKYIISGTKKVICQSNDFFNELYKKYPRAIINPIGNWSGGTGVDSGATNRKLGSDMGDSVTGGGLHGKDLSKADVSLNIYAFFKAQIEKAPIELCCAIGDESVDGYSYSDLVKTAHMYIKNYYGSFEKFAEWGLISPKIAKEF